MPYFSPSGRTDTASLTHRGRRKEILEIESPVPAYPRDDIESIRCAESLQPRVVTARAWVSPRVKRADPWVRGKLEARDKNSRRVHLYTTTVAR